MPAKYVFLARELKQELEQMRAKGQTKLPAENALADQFRVSRQTVRQALALPLAGAFWPRLAALGAGGCATAGVFLLAAWPLGLGEELARMRG